MMMMMMRIMTMMMRIVVVSSYIATYYNKGCQILRGDKNTGKLFYLSSNDRHRMCLGRQGALVHLDPEKA